MPIWDKAGGNVEVAPLLTVKVLHPKLSIERDGWPPTTGHPQFAVISSPSSFKVFLLRSRSARNALGSA
jgi:hypothetical protein